MLRFTPHEADVCIDAMKSYPERERVVILRWGSVAPRPSELFEYVEDGKRYLLEATRYHRPFLERGKQEPSYCLSARLRGTVVDPSESEAPLMDGSMDSTGEIRRLAFDSACLGCTVPIRAREDYAVEITTILGKCHAGWAHDRCAERLTYAGVPLREVAR